MCAICALVQRFEPQGRRYINVHYNYYYYYVGPNVLTCQADILGTRSWEERWRGGGGWGGGGGGEGGEWMTGNETNEMFSNTGAQGCPGITSCIPIKTRA